MNHKKKKRKILVMASWFEMILAAIILIVVLLGSFDTLRLIFNSYIVNYTHTVNYHELNGILAQILLLVIGVEIAVMLTLHKQSALLEVLLYGIARKMLLIPKTDGMLEIFLGVVAIAGLFAIRKYLLMENDDEDDESLMHAIKTKLKKKNINRE